MQTQSYCWKVHRFVITCVVISEYPNISSRDFISAAAVGNLPSPAYQILVPKQPLAWQRRAAVQMCLLSKGNSYLSCASSEPNLAGLEALLTDWCPCSSTTFSKTSLAFYRIHGMITTFPVSLVSLMSKISRHPSPHSQFSGILNETLMFTCVKNYFRHVNLWGFSSIWSDSQKSFTFCGLVFVSRPKCRNVGFFSFINRRVMHMHWDTKWLWQNKTEVFSALLILTQYMRKTYICL